MPFLKKFWIPFTLLILGAGVACILAPLEQLRVNEHLLGFPDESHQAHGVRPLLVIALCLLPFLASTIYTFASTIDRYLTRQFLRCFSICFLAFLAMLFLMEMQNHADKLNQAALSEIFHFYLIQIPGLLMMIIPYSLMLSLLWCLGNMSKSQEIVSMIQSGRSLSRIMLPFIVAGLFLSLATGVFSYHWAPYAEGYKRSMLKALRGEPNTAAENVGYGDPKLRRLWTVGRFPRHFAKGEPLEHLTVTQTTEAKNISERIVCESATWDKEQSLWLFKNAIHWRYANDAGEPLSIPEATTHDEITRDYTETPWQIIRPGLKPEQLGIPELSSWIQNNPDHPLSFKRAYRTWWHFRWAQPVICLVIVFLAAPLGISFSRRGPGGGVAVAIFLSAIMLFCSEVFPTLGESGHLPPILAAWMTNLIFILVALVLFYRRASGRPIYQTFKKMFPSH